jgi:phage tail-like protein
MPTLRNDPYGDFNFIVALGGVQGDGSPGQIIGGFAEVSGLAMEVAYVEYRNGNDKANVSHRLPGLTRFSDLVLRRGIVGSDDLFAWLKETSEGSASPRTVTIRLLDEARNPVVEWVLRRAQPKKWVGPTLVAAGGSGVAIEELVLVYEGLDFN